MCTFVLNMIMLKKLHLVKWCHKFTGHLKIQRHDSIFNELQDKANEADAIGGTIKFVIDDTVVFVDGTGTKNLVSNSNDDADCTISTSASALKDMQS